MASLYIRQDSPYYWLRLYDHREPDPRKRRKDLSTKIEVSEADRKRHDLWRANGSPPAKHPRIKGNEKVKELLQKIAAAQFENNMLFKTGLTLPKMITLEEGLQELLLIKPNIAAKTKYTYQRAVYFFMKVCSNMSIQKYDVRDYNKLLNFFNQDKGRQYSQTSQAIYSRHLYALWNYFIKRGYVKENIILKIRAPKGKVEAIPFNEMQIILNHFQQKKDKAQYYLIYFQLITGFRISTTLVQTWDQIDFENEVITAINVKAKNKHFYFPLHTELLQLLNEIGIKERGRIFSYKYGESPKFWKRDIKLLAERRIISKTYTLHQLRKTFTSWLVNAGVDQALVQKLLDHSDIRVTDDNYTFMETKLLKDQFKKVTFRR